MFNIKPKNAIRTKDKLITELLVEKEALSRLYHEEHIEKIELIKEIKELREEIIDYRIVLRMQGLL